jgi:hypothetical protein
VALEWVLVPRGHAARAELAVSSFDFAARPSARDIRDEQLKEQIMRVWENRRKGRRLYGARKVWPSTPQSSLSTPPHNQLALALLRE